MTNRDTQPEISLVKFMETIEEYSTAMDADRAFSTDEYLEIGRLWNTIVFYTELQREPAGEKFFRLVRDKLMDRITHKLNMTVGRGYSFYSKEHDFMLGGILEERFRYRIKQIRVPPKK